MHFLIPLLLLPSYKMLVIKDKIKIILSVRQKLKLFWYFFLNFNLNSKNYNFVLDLLKNDFSDSNFTIKNSNIFFRDDKNEVLFINNIKKIVYYFNVKEKQNIFIAENEIFNIPYKIELQDKKDIKNMLQS